MDERLQEMLDHYEITKTLKQYCNACDRCDEPRVADVYAEDSWDDHGHMKGPGPDFAKACTKSILTTTDCMYHLIGQTMINVTGDKAGAETYFFAVSRVQEDGVTLVRQLGGRFVDKLVRQDGRWLIKHRAVVRDWTIALPLEHDWVSATALMPAQRSNADPSFDALGIVHSGIPARAPEPA
jgi:hypothetical protein